MTPQQTQAKPRLPYLHPIPVHFPLALFPAAFVALLLYLYSGLTEFEHAAYIMLFFALLATPVAIATGFADWKLRYRGQMTSVFRIKIIGATSLTALSLPALLIRLQHPEVTALPLAETGWIYLGLLAACQVACIVVGHFGGKLIFH